MNLKRNNYGLWVGLFSILGMILLDTNVITDLGRFDIYVKLILGALTALGVISNPSIGTGYKDKL